MADSYVGGGFGRQMSRGQKIAGPEKKDEMAKRDDARHEGHGHSRHATIEKNGPGNFMVKHEHGESGPHGSFKEAAHHAGQAMGESVDEPESGQDVPIENALGMMPDAGRE